jgi:hypothetical protein
MRRRGIEMNLLRRILLAAALLVASVSFGATTVSTDSTKTGFGDKFAGQFTYASLVSIAPCTAALNGYGAFVTDWGTNGTEVRCKGSATRWVPVNGETTLTRMGVAVSAIANTETIVIQTQLPIGALQAGDMIFIRGSVNKSGTTDTLQLTVRWGTAGTTADTALTGLSAYQQLSAATMAGGPIIGFRVISNTSAQKLGANSNASSPYGSTGSAALAAATTSLADASSNAIWITVTIKSSSTTDTVGAQEFSIIHEAG